MRASSYRPFVFWPLAILATLALVATIGLRVATGMVHARLGGLGEGLGVEVTVDSVRLPLWGGIGLEGVTVRGAATAAGDKPVIARFKRLDTDLSLTTVLGGARRPNAIHIVGGDVAITADEHGIVGVTPAPAAADEARSEGPAAALALTFEGLNLRVAGHISDATSAPWLAKLVELAGPPEADDQASGEPALGLMLDEVAFTDLAGEVHRDADRLWTATATGQFQQAAQPAATRFQAALGANGALNLRALAGTFNLALRSAVSDVWLAAQSLEITADTLTLVGLGLAAGAASLSVGEIRVTRGASAVFAPEDRLGALTWLRSPGALTAERVFARRADQLVNADKAIITFAEASDPTPEPSAISVHGVRVASSAKGASLRLSIASIESSFEGLIANIKAGDPLAGIRSIVIETPEGTLRLPSTLLPRGVATSAPTDDDDDVPALADGAMPLLPNDDAALLGNNAEKKPKPRSKKGEGDALDRLFESIEPRLGSVDAFLKGKFGALAATVARLNPVIRGARITVSDDQGTTLFGLDEGAFSLKVGIGGGLRVAFESRLVREGVEQGHFSIGADVDGKGRLSGANAALKGREIAGRLAGLIDHFDVQPNSEVDLQVTWSRPLTDESPHHVHGTFKFKHFAFQYWRISDRQIDDLEGAITFDLSLDPKSQRAVFDLPEIRVGDALMSLSADLTKPKKLRPSFRVRMRMPRQDCGAAAASIPKSLIPNLTDLRLKGFAWFDARLDLDLEKPRELTLKVEGDLDACQVISLAPNIDPVRLRGDFVHHPREPDRGVLEHIAVGRGTRQWIKSEDIPDIVKLAAWVTEDRKWADHGGVRWDLVASALKIDLDHGRFIYGGSTITQQLVKNLYLTRSKHLARKVEEAIIAWHMERVLDKDEILTTYINCIEYGPDIYGIKSAARHYFDKKPEDLDGLEASFIMGLKPYPKAGQRQFEKGVLDYWWIRRVSYVLKLMAKYDSSIITAEEAEAYAPYQPAFRRP